MEKNFENLIKHLEEQLRLESDGLTDIAIDAMEGKSDLPFNTHLVEKQKEYQLQKKRLDGFIDAVEEVKAFAEGYYDDESSKGGE